MGLKKLSVLGLLALVVSGTACSSRTHPSGDDGQYAFEQLDHPYLPDRLWTFKDLSELLPNVLFQQRGMEAAPLAEAVIVGHITSATPGRASDWGSKGRREVPFDGPAMLKTLHLRVAVDEAIGSTDVPERVVVELPIPSATDPVRMAKSLEGAGRLLLFLDQPVDVPDDLPGLFSLAEDGRLIIRVTGDGTLDMSTVAADLRTANGDLETIADIREAAVRPVRTVAIPRPIEAG